MNAQFIGKLLHPGNNTAKFLHSTVHRNAAILDELKVVDYNKFNIMEAFRLARLIANKRDIKRAFTVFNENRGVAQRISRIYKTRIHLASLLVYVIIAINGIIAIDLPQIDAGTARNHMAD